MLSGRAHVGAVSFKGRPLNGAPVSGGGSLSIFSMLCFLWRHSRVCSVKIFVFHCIPYGRHLAENDGSIEHPWWGSTSGLDELCGLIIFFYIQSMDCFQRRLSRCLPWYFNARYTPSHWMLESCKTRFTSVPFCISGLLSKAATSSRRLFSALSSSRNRGHLFLYDTKWWWRQVKWGRYQKKFEGLWSKIRLEVRPLFYISVQWFVFLNKWDEYVLCVKNIYTNVTRSDTIEKREQGDNIFFYIV